jgi:hypothetical protein
VSRTALESELVPANERPRAEHLRVLIANERKDRLALVAPIDVSLRHEVIAREIDVEHVGAVTAGERPDVALVGLGSSSEHARGLIARIVKELLGDRVAPRARSSVPEGGIQAGSSTTSPTPTSRTGKARSTSCCAASPNTTTSKARSAPRADRARQGHPDGTPRHRRRPPPSRCCASTPAPATAN